MIDSEKLANTMSVFIEKNLFGDASFQTTSVFISYTAYNESQKKFNNNDSKISE